MSAPTSAEKTAAAASARAKRVWDRLAPMCATTIPSATARLKCSTLSGSELACAAHDTSTYASVSQAPSMLATASHERTFSADQLERIRRPPVRFESGVGSTNTDSAGARDDRRRMPAVRGDADVATGRCHTAQDDEVVVAVACAEREDARRWWDATPDVVQMGRERE